MRYEKRFAKVDGRQMAYVEAGEGSPILFLHGNPTSSYMWRDVIPHLEPLGRCLAPDLIGMGDSDKLPDSGTDRYRFFEHRGFLDALLVELGVDGDVTLVLHDWGSALGFDWARRHPQAVRGIAYMEAIVRPLRWEEWPEGARRVFQALRSKEGESLILEQNLFVERILPKSILRELTEDEMDAYRRPFLQPGEDRRPTLTWPRELPIDGEPADVASVVSDYAAWMSGCQVPKLFVNVEPGTILTTVQREFCQSWPNQREVTVAGSHYVQEDSPEELGRALAHWYGSLPEPAP